MRASVYVCFVGLWIVLLLSGCGDGSTPSPFTPHVAGDWEISAESASSVTDLIQVRLTQKGNDFQDSGVILYTDQNGSISSGGSCPAGSGTNSVALAFAQDPQIKLTFNEGDNPFTGSGQYDGKTMTGAYAAGPGSGCSNSGSWTAKRTSPLNASFSGPIPNDPNTVVKLQIKESAADHSVSGSGTLSGNINVSLTITGTYVGNAIAAQVTVNIPNQPPQVQELNFYYSPSSKAIYVFASDGTFDLQLNQD